QHRECLAHLFGSDPLFGELLPRRVLTVHLRDVLVEALVDLRELGLDGLELETELLSERLPRGVVATLLLLASDILCHLLLFLSPGVGGLVLAGCDVVCHHRPFCCTSFEALAQCCDRSTQRTTPRPLQPGRSSRRYVTRRCRTGATRRAIVRSTRGRCG